MPRIDVVHSYVLHSDFVDREDELRQLSKWYLTSPSPILILDAIGGEGKSALAWVWMHAAILGRRLDVRVALPAVKDNERPATIMWWSFYGDNSKFRDFLSYLHGALCTSAHDHKFGDELVRETVDRLIEEHHLIVLDGLERILVAYDRMDSIYHNDRVDEWGESYLPGTDYSAFADSLSIRFFRELASRGAQSKLLITTRITPSSLQTGNRKSELIAGVTRLSLKGLNVRACHEFLNSGGVRLSQIETRQLCAPIGFHAFHVRLLRGLLQYSPRSEIEAVRGLLGRDGEADTNLLQSRLLARAVESLSEQLRTLLKLTSLFRMSMPIHTLKALISSDLPKDEVWLMNAIRKLEDRGCLYFDARSRTLDLHPIMRAFLYPCIHEDDRRRLHGIAAQSMREANDVVRDIELGMAEQAPGMVVAEHFTGVTRSAFVRREWVDQSRLLVEFFHQLHGAKRIKDAIALYRERLSVLLFYRLAAYSDAIGLLEGVIPPVGSNWGEDVVTPAEQVWLLNALAMCYSRMAAFDRAGVLYERAIAICRSQGLIRSLAIILQNHSEDYWYQGELAKSEALLLESRRLAEKEGDEIVKALSYRLRGFLLNLRGSDDGDKELLHSLAVFSEKGLLHPQIYAHTNLAWGYVIKGSPLDAFAQLEQAEVLSQRLHYVRDAARITFLRGKALAALGTFVEAEAILRDALRQCRDIGLVEFEADLLAELARTLLARPSARSGGEMWQFLREGLDISRRYRFRLQEADVHLLLAQAALARRVRFDENVLELRATSVGHIDTALREARAAFKCAECSGGDYVYRRVHRESLVLLRLLEHEVHRRSSSAHERRKRPPKISGSRRSPRRESLDPSASRFASAFGEGRLRVEARTQWRVFLSSVSRELAEERRVVERALRQMIGPKFVGMEYFGSRPSTPRETCLAELSQCRVYVGVLGRRYGSIDPISGVSYTEMEFREARRRRMPCLLYLSADAVFPLEEGDEDNHPRQLRFREEVKKGHTVTFYQSAHELATRVVVDLHNLKERGEARL